MKKKFGCKLASSFSFTANGSLMRSVDQELVEVPSSTATCWEYLFFLCRIVIMPIYYNNCYVAWGTKQQKELGGLISFYWISTSAVLDVINLYWFSKIVRGAMKITRNLKERKEG